MPKIYIPPIKIQGIKTKLAEWILNQTLHLKYNRWIEPFLGSGVIGFNSNSENAIFSDINPHIINFYNSLKNNKINSILISEYLYIEGDKLKDKDEDYYYEVRERFNQNHNPLDFLFLSRSCFNGMIRFNKELKYNVPYGHKRNRFSKSYITKIVNQVKNIEFMINTKNWNFYNIDFKDTIKYASIDDIIYCDPPYIGRHVDYYDSWDYNNEKELKECLINSNSRFILSTWHSNKYRTNEYLETIWKDFYCITKEHFYYIGGKEENRNSIVEALIMNFKPLEYNNIKPNKIFEMELF